MPTLENIDIFDGSSLVRQGTTVIELTRIAKVKLAAGETGSSDQLERMVANTPGMPQSWEAHPTLFNLRVVSYEPVAQSGFDATIRIRYVNTAFTTWRGGATVESVATNRGLNGDVIILPPPEGQRGTGKQPATVNVLAPRMTITAERVERAKTDGPVNPFPTPGQPTILDPGIDPLRVAAEYIGKTNKKPFLHGGRGEWLMTNVTFDNSEFGNAAWRMGYEMQFSKEGWNPEVFYIDTLTGEPMLDTNEPPSAPGRKVISYERIDFGRLNLL